MRQRARKIAAVLAAWCLAVAACGPAQAAATRESVVSGSVTIAVLAEGRGPVIVILPSLGRDGHDYDAVSARLVARGFRVLRPQPRGMDGSAGPMSGLTLHDYANDVAHVIQHENAGPVVVVGHAFGNFVGRMLATDRPDLVRGLVMAAASAGKVPAGDSSPPIAPDVRFAIDHSGNPSLPEAERLAYLQKAFFAPGHDPHVWLGGWHLEAQKAESAATAATPIDAYFAGGRASILDLQAADDTVAPRRLSHVLKDALGDRVTIVVIPHAGHALAPEQPRAMADEIVLFAKRLPPHG